MRHSLRSLPGSWLSFGLLASLSACDRGTTAAECSCPPPAAAPAAAAECPASSPVAAPEVTPKASAPATVAPSPPPAPPSVAPVDASDVPSAIGALAFPVDPPKEESPLSLLFQPRMKELVVEEVSRDRQFRRVQLSLSSFVVRGRSPAVRAINDEVRRAEQRDDWPEHAQGRDGDIDVYCAHGVATSELFSFGCEILDSTLMVEEVNEGTGGVPPNATGSGYTFAIVDDTLHPVALTDLLRPDADFAARIRELVAADEWEDTAETRPWREGECGLGLNAAWMLSDDGLKLWSDDCPPLVFDLDMLEPLLLPGGVVARYFQARRAAEIAAAAAAEREAAQAAAAAAAAASTDAPTSPLSPASPTGP